MDKTRRNVLAAAASAGIGVVAWTVLHRADAPETAAEGIRIVPGTRAEAAPAQVAVAEPAMAAWQQLQGQRLVLSSGGTGIAVSVAAVTALAPTMVGAAPGGRSAALPAGVRQQGFSVLFDVHSGQAPVTDMLMDVDRAVEGLSRVFVQPATAAAGVPRVVAYFN